MRRNAKAIVVKRGGVVGVRAGLYNAIKGMIVADTFMEDMIVSAVRRQLSWTE